MVGSTGCGRQHEGADCDKGSTDCDGQHKRGCQPQRPSAPHEVCYRLSDVELAEVVGPLRHSHRRLRVPALPLQQVPDLHQ